MCPKDEKEPANQRAFQGRESTRAEALSGEWRGSAPVVWVRMRAITIMVTVTINSQVPWRGGMGLCGWTMS